jgi:DNA-binding MarR family transcriptional regulator
MNQQADPSIVFNFITEVGIISQLSTTLFERALTDGLTTSQFSVLNWFSRVDNQASPGRLATAFQVTGGAMTNTLKKLEAKGLVTIEPDANSGRQKKVSRTAKGEEVRDRSIAAAAPVFEEFARLFAATEIPRQMDGLKKMRKYLDERRYQ